MERRGEIQYPLVEIPGTRGRPKGEGHFLSASFLALTHEVFPWVSCVMIHSRNGAAPVLTGPESTFMEVQEVRYPLEGNN